MSMLAPRFQQGSAASAAVALVAVLVTLLAAPVPARGDGDGASMASLVERIERPGAAALAVSDAHNLLAICYSDDDRARLAVYPLDAAAEPGTEPTVVDLPRPDELSAHRHYPLALAIHPTLPVLYVWQDIAGVDSDDSELVYEHFEHLVLYKASANGAGLERLEGLVSSNEVSFGQSAAALAVSGDGLRLFIPNLYGNRDAQSGRQGGVGYFDLDDDGELVPVAVPIEGSLDGRGINEFDMQIRPQLIYTGFRRPVSDGSWRFMHRLPSHSFVAPTQRTVVFDAQAGIGLWDTENRQQALSEINVPDVSSSGAYLTDHPDLPYLYAANRDNDRILRIAHVDGFPTLLPRVVTIDGVSSGFASRPAVVRGQHHGLAIGGSGRIYLIPLDDDGHIAGSAGRVDLEVDGSVRAFAYSPGQDRIYVAVDEIPEDDEE